MVLEDVWTTITMNHITWCYVPTGPIRDCFLPKGYQSHERSETSNVTSCFQKCLQLVFVSDHHPLWVEEFLVNMTYQLGGTGHQKNDNSSLSKGAQRCKKRDSCLSFRAEDSSTCHILNKIHFLFIHSLILSYPLACFFSQPDRNCKRNWAQPREITGNLWIYMTAPLHISYLGPFT